MADLDDFFAKKDKKKKGKKGSKFAKANTDILAQNLIENDKKTEDDEKKAAAMLATSEANRAGAAKDNTGVRYIFKFQNNDFRSPSNKLNLQCSYVLPHYETFLGRRRMEGI